MKKLLLRISCAVLAIIISTQLTGFAAASSDTRCNSDEHSDFKVEEKIDYILAKKTLNQICGICGETVDSKETQLDTLIDGKTFIPSPEEIIGRLSFVSLGLAFANDECELINFGDFDGKYLVSEVTCNNKTVGLVQFMGKDSSVPYEDREERNKTVELEFLIASKSGYVLLVSAILACDPSLSLDEVLDITNILMDKGTYLHNGLEYEFDTSVLPLLTITVAK